MSYLIASGVNLDLLGRREPNIYGKQTLKDMEELLKSEIPRLQKQYKIKKLQLSFFQSNDEAAFLEELSKDWQGIVINAGAWSHTSLAIADRLAGLGTPYAEVHLSNLSQRESFRHQTYLAAKAVGVVQGFGIESYLLGLEGLLSKA